MKIASLPPTVMARLLQLESDARDAQSKARDAADAVSHARNSLRTLINGEDLARVEQDLPRLLEAAEIAANTYSSLTQTAERCRRWLDGLPDGTTLEVYAPKQTSGDPAEALRKTREQLTAATSERNALGKIPVPSDDIEERVRAHVEELAQRARPYVRGVTEGSLLSVRWPPSPTSTIANTGTWHLADANPLMLAALLQPDQLAEVILAEIDREANETLPIAERQKRIAELADEIEELERQASDLTYQLVQSGDVRTYHNASPDAVLGVIERQERVAA